MLDVLVVSPFERPDPRLVRAAARAGATAVLDLGRDARRAARALSELRGVRFGVRVPEGVRPDPSAWPAEVELVVVGPELAPADFPGRRVLVEVRTVDEARAALASGAAGVIGVGHEAGGRVGPESAFVLAQHLAAAGVSPFWIRGGIGVHSAAACALAGAAGVVLDAQLALVAESGLPGPVRRAVAAMDGSETTVLGGHRVYTRPDLDLPEHLEPHEVLPRLGADDVRVQLLPVGLDGALAAPLARSFRTVAGVVAAVREGAAAHLAQAAETAPLAPLTPLAAAHRTRYPIAQGPMTRVSDRPAFAAAVARAGALPFVALSMLDGPTSETLLRDTAAACGDLPWGVGILGFVPPELRDPQIAAIRAVRPPVALIAGGRPSQARELEAEGITTWLHVPSPALLDAFLADGARRFVLEGRECGGHVGPRSSFVLWEQAVERILAFPQAEQVHLLFAGGIHDARSAAMVAALAAPLAARGVKIGVLMGTAYLFTEEAVTTGAIGRAFQEEALATRTTALLETAPGHATRCALTPFVDAFEAEKRRLRAAGVDPKERWAALERLNLGRLRIASKGVKREGSALVEVDEATQRAEGMFMIGEVAALRDGVTTLAALHADVSEGGTALVEARASRAVVTPGREAPPPVDVAIVGMACVFPDAPDVDEFWRNILANHDAIREIPPERWRADLFHDPDGPPGVTTPSKWGGLLPETRFDPFRYGLPPNSLASIDPAQLLALEVARRALEDAGYGHRPFDRSRTSVVFGTESGSDLSAGYSFRARYRQFVGELPPALDEALPSLTEDSFPGVLANVLAGRIANRLDLGGANCTVDAACASSFAALDLAVKELTLGTSDMVLCGGADLHNGLDDYLLFSSVHALSPSGRCRTFDASADGIVLGEGVACVVLKRLEDARRDGDRVYAVIRGVGASSDGRSLGLTAPRREGQRQAVERAWAQARISPAEVGLVEAHGTGTVVGDRTELGTLTDAFGDRAREVTLGSVKSQIGHTKCAAGLAGLIKAALAVHHGVLPPAAPVRTPNPAWDAARSPFRFRSTPAPWTAPRRVAAVSAFGFGGTNYHVVLEGHDAAPERPRALGAELFLFRGDDARIDRTLDQLLAWLDAAEVPPLGALARAANTGTGPVRLAVVATSHADLRVRLSEARARRPSEGAVFVAGPPVEGDVAFLFPGQGSQRPGMLADLFVAFPELQRFLALAPDLAARIFPPDAFDDASRQAQRDALTDTRAAQPALGIVSLAAAAFLESCGVTASMAGGHSYGELAALAWAGAVAEDDLVPLSRARADAILSAAGEDPGTMAAVQGDAASVRTVLASHPDVVIANHNAPRQVVIAGPTPAVAEASRALEAAGLAVRAIPVACAFHSPVVAEARRTFAEVLEQVEIGTPAVPVWSNVTASPHEGDVRELLARQLAEPVRFTEQIEAMWAAGARIFVEVGPGRVLTGLVRRILGDRPHRVVALEDPGAPGLPRLLAALAELAVAGVPVDAEALFAGRDLPEIALAHPPARKAGAWIVDGQRARPAEGPLPKHAFRPIVEPVGASVPAAVAPVGGDDRERAVLTFLGNMQALAEAQRDAMLAFLGSAPAPRSEPAARPVARAAEPEPRPQPSPVVPVPPSAASRPVSLLDALLEVVSDRTGYPPEMLDPDLDLEADLSIDSIKRIEILDALGSRLGGGDRALDDEAVEALASRRTLRQMVAWLEAAGLGGTPATPAPEAPTPPRDVLATLLEVVSERTGYPTEMLDPDLDLEADLSIDSIKRIEILDALGHRLGLSGSTLDDDAIEALAARRTLREMVAWLDARNGPAEAPAPAAEAAPAPVAEEAAPRVQRWAVEPLPLPVPEPRPIRARVALLDPDPERARAVAERLRAHGVRADVASGKVDADVLVQIDGEGPLGAFPALRRLLEGGATAVLGVDDGDHGLDGLYKSAAREYPDRTVRLVSVGDARDPEAVAEAVRHELAVTRAPAHVRWRGDVREVFVPRPAPLSGEGSLPLDRDGVVLVTGGARGITARIAEALAREVPCTFVLVGRSVPEPEPDDLRDAADAAAVRRVLLARGDLGGPAEVEREVQRVLRSREVRASVATLKAAGARVDHRAVDVRDPVAFRVLLDDVYATYGRLDGVIHGAGIVEDRLMRDKTRESFARVYETKVASARVLEEALRDDVRFVVFFGSVSGVFGNRGQADYAAANATLDAIARRLGDRITGRVVSIDWGPWAGAGMVSPELARAYGKRGIPLIPLEDGVRAFLDELRAGRREERQVIWQAGPLEAFGGELVPTIDADGTPQDGSGSLP